MKRPPRHSPPVGPYLLGPEKEATAGRRWRVVLVDGDARQVLTAPTQEQAGGRSAPRRWRRWRACRPTP